MRQGFEDLDLDRLRRRRSEKWRAFPPDVLPAFIAEMDYDLAGRPGRADPWTGRGRPPGEVGPAGPAAGMGRPRLTGRSSRPGGR